MPASEWGMQGVWGAGAGRGAGGGAGRGCRAGWQRSVATGMLLTIARGTMPCCEICSDRLCTCPACSPPNIRGSPSPLPDRTCPGAEVKLIPRSGRSTACPVRLPPVPPSPDCEPCSGHVRRI